MLKFAHMKLIDLDLLDFKKQISWATRNLNL